MKNQLIPRGLLALSCLAVLFPLCGCGGNRTTSPVEAPGKEKDAKSKILEAGAAVLQHKGPLNRINIYLNGFHFYNGEMNGQMEAHHYVSQLNEEVHQALIYDGNGPDAKLMGVEYIISERLFKQLPEAEKLLWHSHRYEVKSGTLIAPGIPETAEHELMEKIVSTYGKTIHTWHTDKDKILPLGAPALMMAFTKDGQADPAMIAKRDNRFRVSSLEKRENRSDISAGPADPAADSWQQGKIIQFRAVEIRDDGSYSVQESHHASNLGKKYFRSVEKHFDAAVQGASFSLLTAPFNRSLKFGKQPPGSNGSPCGQKRQRKPAVEPASVGCYSGTGRCRNFNA